MAAPLPEHYDAELAELERCARDYIKARETEAPFPLQLVLVGMLTVQCARVYNLDVQAGILDPRTLFTGRPE
jgi:hypothetical protein